MQPLHCWTLQNGLNSRQEQTERKLLVAQGVHQSSGNHHSNPAKPQSNVVSSLQPVGARCHSLPLQPPLPPQAQHGCCGVDEHGSLQLTFSLTSNLDELGWGHRTQGDLSPASLALPSKYSFRVNAFLLLAPSRRRETKVCPLHPLQYSLFATPQILW